jgi:hypothetical protein
MNKSKKLKADLINCANLMNASIQISELVHAQSFKRHTTSCIIWTHNNNFQFACETPIEITQGFMTCKIGCGFSFFEKN